MTKKEKVDPCIFNGSRKRRIAKGSGTTIQDVNRLLKQFEDMKKMMKQMTGMQNGKERSSNSRFANVWVALSYYFRKNLLSPYKILLVKMELMILY